MTRRQQLAQSRGMTRAKWEHGTYNGYCNKGCRCKPCTKAYTEYCAEYRQRGRRSRELIDGRLVSAKDIQHGTYYAYVGHHCRCVECSEAKRLYAKEYRRRRKVAA